MQPSTKHPSPWPPGACLLRTPGKRSVHPVGGRERPSARQRRGEPARPPPPAAPPAHPSRAPHSALAIAAAPPRLAIPLPPPHRAHRHRQTSPTARTPRCTLYRAPPRPASAEQQLHPGRPRPQRLPAGQVQPPYHKQPQGLSHVSGEQLHPQACPPLGPPPVHPLIPPPAQAALQRRAGCPHCPQRLPGTSPSRVPRISTGPGQALHPTQPSRRPLTQLPQPHR